MKTLIKKSLCTLAVASALLGASSSAFANQDVSLPKGDGVMIFDSYADMKCMGGTCPLGYQSISDRVKSGYFGTGAVYLMPMAGKVTGLPIQQADGGPVWGCSSSNKYQKAPLAGLDLFNRPLLYTGGDRSFCNSLTTIVNTYKTVPNSKVFPLLTLSGLPYPKNATKTMPAVTMAQALTESKAIGALLGAKIGNTQADGVAFDWEPGSSTVTMAERIQLGAAFIQGLESKIQSWQYVAIFDGANVIKSLVSPTNPSEPLYNNIIPLVSTYDLLSGIQSPASQPNSLAQYNGPGSLNINNKGNTYVQSMMNVYQKFAGVMFVLPASATTTLYNGIMGIDVNKDAAFLAKDGKTDQLVLPQRKGSPAVPTPQKCVDTVPTASPAYQKLVNFLVIPNDPSAINPYSAGVATGNPKDLTNLFKKDLGSTGNNCLLYPNYVVSGTAVNTPMLQYFKAAQNAVSVVNNNPKYIGSILYSDRSPYNADFTGAKHYFSSLGSPALLKAQWIQLPVQITDKVWGAFKANQANQSQP